MSLISPFESLPITLQGEHDGYHLSRDDNRESKESYMSIIYRAKRYSDRKLLALKTVWCLSDVGKDTKEEWQKAIKVFKEEIGHLRNLGDISGVVTIYDQGEHKDAPWYVMEYIEGPTITEGLREKPLATQIQVLTQFLKTLNELHQRGCIHRDLKPSNVLLRTPEEPVILDFGISKVIEMGWQSITQHSGIQGTPIYQAPEQLSGKGKIEQQLDIWTVGILFYEVLTGEHPLQITENTTLRDIQNRILYEPITYLRDLRDDIDASLAEICHKALAKSPGDRYKNASEMLADLSLWKETNFLTHIRTGENCLTFYKKYKKEKFINEAFLAVKKAHKWQPYHPKLEKLLIGILSVRWKVNLEIKWKSPLGLEKEFWKNFRNQEPQPFLAKIYDIHEEEPKFVAVEKKKGRKLSFIIKERFDRGEIPMSTIECLDLVITIKKLLNYFAECKFECPKLTVDSIYADENNGKIENFILWRGWEQDFTITELQMIKELFTQCLSNESLPLEDEIDDIIYDSENERDLLNLLQEEFSEG